MKKTAWKDALRNIQKRFVSWLSMVTIVLIGTSVILGLYFSYRSLSYYGNYFIDVHDSKDMDLACSLGVRQQEVERILEIEGVADAEGIISFPGVITAGDKNGGATMISISQRISRPYVIQGEMPEESNEIALNPELAKRLNISIGDEISFGAGTSRLANTLINDKYIVTGMVGYPDYITKTMTDYCVMPPASFDTSASAFDYTNILIKLHASDKYPAISNKLSKEITAVRNRIEEIIPDMGKERMETLGADMDAEYAKAEAQVNEKLADAKKQIDSAQKEFDDKIGAAQKQLDDAEKELNEGKEKAEKELAAGWKKIQDGEKEYNDKIADGQRQLEDGEKQMEKELADARFKLFDGMLEIDKNERLLNEKEAEYKAGLEKYLEGAEKLKKGREELDNGWKQYNDGVAIINAVLGTDDLKEFAKALEDVKPEAAAEIYEVAEREPLERVEGLLAVYDKYVIEEIKELLEEFAGIGEIRGIINKLRDAKNTLDSKESEYRSGKAQAEDAHADLEEARRKLDEGWFSLNQAKVKLAEGEAELAKKEPEARAQLAAKKAEFEQKKAEGAKQIEDAKKTYATKKKEAMDEIALHEKELEDGKAKFKTEKETNEARLNEAWDEYNKGKKEAEDKLAEIKREIDKNKNTEIKWFVQTLDANLYFLEFKSYCQVLKKVCMVFSPIYAAIVVLVCFFTMAIIVEEQSKQIGTCKALGMYKSEIRKKYLLFGTTAAIVGALIGIGGGFFFEKIIGDSIKTVFVFGAPKHKFDLWPLLLVPLAACFVTWISVFWSSEMVLSCSAIGLVSGNEPVKKGRTKASSGRKRSVYTSLILNNFMMDLGRETVTVVIILVCCFLIGLGTTIKLGHAGSLNHQVNSILNYDIELSIAENITDEQRAKVMEAVNKYDHIDLCKLQTVLQSEDGQTLTIVYCPEDTEKFRQFYEVKDLSGKDVEIPDDAMLTTIEMETKNNLKDGDVVTIITNNLKMGEVPIRGHFMLHVGKACVMSSKCYKEVFGVEPLINDFMIKVGDSDIDEVEEELSNLPGISAIGRSDDVLREKAGMSRLYTIVVIIVIVFSIMLSFMILLNLSNILVAHRMKELLTMRVNGFTNGEVIGYLAREILLTTSLGLILGLAIGIPATNFIMPNIESNGFMFLRQIFYPAWILAVGCNLIFSVTINSISFRKINSVPLTDITRY